MVIEKRFTMAALNPAGVRLVLLCRESYTATELQAQANVRKATQQRSAEPEMLAGAQLPGRSDE